MIYAVMACVLVAVAYWWRKRGEKAASIKHCAIGGDSLARRTGFDGSTMDRELEVAMGMQVVCNAGQGGHTTAQIAEQLPVLLASGAQVVVLTGGCNDVIQSVAVPQVVQAMMQMDAALQQAGMVVVRLLPHYGRGKGYDNAVVDAICAAYAKPWCVDLRELQSQLQLPDGLHFSVADKQVVATKIAAAVTKLS